MHLRHTVKPECIKLGFYEYMVYIEALARSEQNPIYSMSNKLGYIELYILKTRLLGRFTVSVNYPSYTK